MEDMIPLMKDMLKNAIKIQYIEEKREILLKVSSQHDLKANFADSNEVKIMFHMFGGLDLNYPMKIKIDNKNQKILISLNTYEQFQHVKRIMETLWDNTVNIFNKLALGDFSVIRNIEDVDE